MHKATHTICNDKFTCLTTPKIKQKYNSCLTQNDLPTDWYAQYTVDYHLEEICTDFIDNSNSNVSHEGSKFVCERNYDIRGMIDPSISKYTCLTSSNQVKGYNPCCFKTDLLVNANKPTYPHCAFYNSQLFFNYPNDVQLESGYFSFQDENCSFDDCKEFENDNMLNQLVNEIICQNCVEKCKDSLPDIARASDEANNSGTFPAAQGDTGARASQKTLVPGDTLLSENDSDTNSENDLNINSTSDCSSPFEHDLNLNDIRFLTLNVGSLPSKMKFPDLTERIQEYDVVTLTETKLDDVDDITFDNFTCFYKNRRRYRAKSGGVALLIRNEYLDLITIVESKRMKNKIQSNLYKYYRFVNFSIPEECIIFELKLTIPNDDKTFVCSSIYMPPSGSSYENKDLLINLSGSLSHFDSSDYIFFGDFNARTGTMQDYIGTHDNDIDLVSMEELIEQFQIQKQRTSQDNYINPFGSKLIDFCMTNSVLILNGRIGDDAQIGKMTCKEASVVDYNLASPTIFPLISHFKIENFDRCLSDAHCCISMTLSFPNPVTVTSQEKTDSTNIRFTKPAWSHDNCSIFIDKINMDKIRKINIDLQNALTSNDNPDQSFIDNTNKEIKETILDAASAANLIKTITHRNKHKNKSQTKLPWFDNQCRYKRNILRKKKKKYNKNKTQENAEKRQEAYNNYRSLINKKYKGYIHRTHVKLRKLRCSNPRLFHQTLKNILSNQDPQNKMPSHDDLTNHFENLNNINDDSNGDETNITDIDHTIPENIDNSSLNAVITKEEVELCIKKLKNNKSSGSDQILNEYLKASTDKMLTTYTLFFNIILKTGKIPDDWAIGTICPIYKGKGDPLNSDNYRGITILSCMSKLFTSILNKRINSFLETNKLLGLEQAGFRTSCSTIDHIFSLHFLIDLYLQRKKRIFCSFIDYSKAFDRINRSILWEKLLKCNISGNILSVIQDMYSKAKSYVKSFDNPSTHCKNYFTSNIGVRQGENLSPILFSLFLNDLKEYLAKHVKNLSLPSGLSAELRFTDLYNYMTMFLLLYADDTVILTETALDMQKALDKLSVYCNNNKLVINVDKTKSMVFSRGKVRNLPELYLNGGKIEIVSNYKYLGSVLNYNNKFNRTIDAQCTAANKAMFSLLKKTRKLNLSIDLQIELYDKCVKPVLLYGSEIWACSALENIDKTHIRFLKMILGVKSSTPTCMVLGELGTYPVSLDAKLRMLCYWYKLCTEFDKGIDKLSILMFRLSMELFNTSVYKLPWLANIQSILNKLGLTYIWNGDWTMSPFAFKNLAKQRLKDHYIQFWEETINSKNICSTYKMFKRQFEFENYLNPFVSNVL